MVTKIIDFIHKHPKYKLVKSWQVFQKFSRDWQDILIFWDRKSRNQLFFNFFSTKVSDFISNLNDNCSQLSFEVYNVCVAQKLRISEFLINFLSPGTWPLRRPPEAAISTSATSIGYQILAEYVSFHMRYCLWSGMEMGQVCCIFGYALLIMYYISKETHSYSLLIM